MQRYRKHRRKFPFLTTLSFYSDCLFGRKDRFFQVFTRILKVMSMIGHQTEKKIQFVYVGLLIMCKTIYITCRVRYGIARNGPKRRKNLKTFKRKRKIVKAVYKLIY